MSKESWEDRFDKEFVYRDRCGNLRLEIDDANKIKSFIAKEIQRVKDSEGVGEPFRWMRSWLNAYAKENKDIDVDKIMDWIYKQPMGC